MPLHPLAGKPAPTDMLIDVQRLEDAYYANQPDLDNPTQRVAFGTSGHRGTPFDSNFTARWAAPCPTGRWGSSNMN